MGLQRKNMAKKLAITAAATRNNQGCWGRMFEIKRNRFLQSVSFVQNLRIKFKTGELNVARI